MGVHNAPLRPKPEVIEMFGSPELFADGWLVCDQGTSSTVSVIFFVTRAEAHREIARVHIPRTEYEYWRAVYRDLILSEMVH